MHERYAMQTVFRSPIIGAVSLEMIAKMLKKTLTSAMLALTALVSFNVQAEEEEKVLYVYNWSEYMEPSVIPQASRLPTMCLIPMKFSRPSFFPESPAMTW